ncbi:hypothetical protein BZL43_14725 [Pseudomonas sp. PICF141]|nr:hypothetical protein BZL43_14725 [Pseudomonas sp. PICF141]
MEQVWFSPDTPTARLPNGTNQICSSCRACEAAFGCAAVVSPINAVSLTHRNLWFYDCCAAERSLASSAAATRLHGYTATALQRYSATALQRYSAAGEQSAAVTVIACAMPLIVWLTRLNGF